MKAPEFMASLAALFGTAQYGAGSGRGLPADQTRLGREANVSHTKKGPGRPTSYQANGYKRPGRNAALKRIAKDTGKARGVEGVGK